MIKFLINLFTAAVLLTAAGHLASYFHIIPALPSFFHQTIILLTAGTAIIFRFLFRADNTNFIQFYLLTITLKLIAYLAYLVTVAFKDPAAAAGNAIAFIIAYFIFTALEVAFLYRKINDQ